MARLFGGLNLDNINKALNTLIKKNDDVQETYNPEKDLQALREREDVIYAALGRQAYDEGGEARFPETAAQLSEIEERRSEIFEKVARIEAEKERLARQQDEEQYAPREPEEESGVACPNCGASCPAGARFCQECGERITSEKPKCAQCGAELKPGMRFCSECGARVGEAQPAEPPAAEPEEPAEEPIDEPPEE